MRQKILKSIPHELYPAVAGGIGLFIAFIGLKNAGIIVANSSTMISLGNVRSPETALALFGILLVAALQVWQVRGGMLIGIVGTALSGWTLGLVHWHPTPYSLSAITATAFKLDLRGALHFGLFEIVFVFLFVDLFDNLGTLVAVTKKAGLIKDDHEIPRVDRILLADATATICGSLVGTSTVTSYVESAAGVAAGGRSGVAAIVTGILFIRRALHRAISRSVALGRDRACADRGGFADAVDNQRNLLARSAGGVSGLPHPDHDSADLFDCQWAWALG